MKLLRYSIKNSFARKLTSLLTVLGVGLVVFVFCAVLMLSNGLEQVLVDTGEADNVVVIRQSATTEVVSILWRQMADVVKADPSIAVDESGAPLFAGELVVLINKPRKSDGGAANLTVRGVDEASLKVRPHVKLAAGRWWREGTSEIVAGVKLAENFEGCQLGDQIKFGAREWTIVGLMEADGSGFESEIWGDVDQLMAAFERPVYSSFVFRLKDPTTFEATEKRLEGDRRLTVDVIPEIEYYRRQSQSFTTFIGILGTVISIVFSLGAIVGAMITMYAAVANRTREIGTLRALGFGRVSILGAFLTESLLIAFAGGLIGIACANILSLREVQTTNFDTFAEIAFSFRMSLGIAGKALVFALVMGIVGGFLPAVRASRFRIINALRAR
ncbi:MAG: ABC transporter permease [candidate division Zixibacteria bacterium]|nr:ABC transporter permease [candidate division Zixibacteria bacterium]